MIINELKPSYDGLLYNFHAFVGDRKGHLVIFLLSIVVCYCMKKKMQKYIVYPFVIGAILIMNPIFYWIVGERFLSGIYWRLFWIFPAGVVVGVISIEFAEKIRYKKTFFAFLFLIIIFTGKPTINREAFEWMDNTYQLPQETIDVCDYILEQSEGQQCKVIAPYALLTTMRQYTSKIDLYYGRNVDGYISGLTNEQNWAYTLMTQEEPELEPLWLIAACNGVDYIIFDSELNKVQKNALQYGLDKVGKVDKYVIYKVVSSEERD